MAKPTIITTNTAFAPFNILELLKAAFAAREVSKQRRALARLSNDALKDLGLTPAQRRAECNRRFWQQG